MTTGTDLEWPADLPCPQELPTQSAERRILGDGSGLFESRVGQTDRKAFEDYVFPPYSPAQALALDAFWTTTLNKGGKWFSAPWPRPEGRLPTARRFVGPPNWEYIHTGKGEGGYWRVSGTFEVRGTGELPVEPDPPSAWNPDDMLTADLPCPLDLTENFRLATRATRVDSYEGGVRGTKSHAASGKWYFELEIVSVGDGATPTDNQDMQFGMLDATMKNEGEFPLNDESNPTNTSTFVVASSRFDGIVWSSYPTFNASPGTFGTPPAPGDVYGFAWEVGVALGIYRNGVLVVTATLPTVAAMFPYFNAGSTNAAGPDTVDSGESVRIRTSRRQFAYYPPTGYYDWG